MESTNYISQAPYTLYGSVHILCKHIRAGGGDDSNFTLLMVMNAFIIVLCLLNMQGGEGGSNWPSILIQYLNAPIFPYAECLEDPLRMFDDSMFVVSTGKCGWSPPRGRRGRWWCCPGSGWCSRREGRTTWSRSWQGPQSIREGLKISSGIFLF